jgi:hypothetical protein
MIGEFNKPVALSFKLLWEHDKGEFSHVYIAAAADKPEFSFVNKAGAIIDVESAEYTVADVFGVHIGGGKVYWAHVMFNNLYLNWPDSITPEQKTALQGHLLHTKFIAIKGAI